MKTDFDSKQAGYFDQDESLRPSKNYYSDGMDESDERVTRAVWAGSLCKGLGLDGFADEETFEKLQSGNLPNGQRMRGGNQTGQEILLHDMTLSAPKSVTLHALEDPRLFDAHMNACNKAIAVVEQHYALYRHGEDRELALGQGVIAAVIPHWTNRNNEPQLHSHCAIFNGTKTESGQWRSIQFHPLSRERWMGSYYRSCLADEVQSLGYTIRETAMENGAFGFEIDGLSREQVEAFSTRTVELLAVAKEKGIDSKKANLITRKDKTKQVSWDELRDTTRAALSEMGATLQTPSADIRKNDRSATDAVNSAISHLSERVSRFTCHDIYQHAFNHMDGHRLEDIDQAIASNGELLDYGLITGDTRRSGHFTTIAALDRQTKTVNSWMDGQASARPILEKDEALKKLDALGVSLNEGQSSAVVGILSSRDRHQVLHGLSGVGKTRTLKPFAELAKAEGVKLKWFAPSLSAAEKLSDEVGDEAATLQRLVYTKYKVNRGDMLVIDEGGLASAEMADLLVQKANDSGARILFVGDCGQNRPINAGTPVISLIEAGATTHYVSEILRQKDPQQKKAVEMAASGDASGALELLNDLGYVQEIPDRGERSGAIASEYLSLPPEERAKTLIVAGTHAEKDAIVRNIRDGLKDEGHLGKSAKVVQLRDRGWTTEQGLDVRNYSVGDYVSLNRSARSCPLIKDEFYRVTEVGESLTVESYTGKTMQFNPSQYKSKTVYSSQSIDIAVGDEMRWQYTNIKRDRKNGSTFTVMGIDDSFATLKASNGDIQRLPLDAPIAADYTITTTNYRAQGSDRPRVLVSATDDPTSNKNAFYVAISRQTHELKVWTSNLDALRDRVSRVSEHPNPLDAIANTAISPLLQSKAVAEALEQWREKPEQRTEVHIAKAITSLNEPDELIEEYMTEILESYGTVLENGDRRYVGQNWTIEGGQGSLSIWDNDGGLGYQVTNGRVTNNTGLQSLREICADAIDPVRARSIMSR